MQIGVLSDSHDNLPALRRALAQFRRIGVGAVFHAGDIVAPFAARLLAPPQMPDDLPVHVCYGNNDGERAGLKDVLPQILKGPVRVELAGRRIVMHHFIDWLSKADQQQADLVITGHTHEPVIQRRDNRLYLNPGECGGWLTGRATCAVVDLEDLSAQLVDIAV